LPPSAPLRKSVDEKKITELEGLIRQTEELKRKMRD
jgi:hypothetical protein